MGYAKEMSTVGISLKSEVTSKYIINSGCEIKQKVQSQKVTEISSNMGVFVRTKVQVDLWQLGPVPGPVAGSVPEFKT